jgi:hypothetical protein
VAFLFAGEAAPFSSGRASLQVADAAQRFRCGCDYLIDNVESLYMPAAISTITSPTLWFAVAVFVTMRLPTGTGEESLRRPADLGESPRAGCMRASPTELRDAVMWLKADISAAGSRNTSGERQVIGGDDVRGHFQKYEALRWLTQGILTGLIMSLPYETRNPRTNDTEGNSAVLFPSTGDEPQTVSRDV